MKCIMLLLCLCLGFSAGAAIDTRQFNSVAQEQQYRELTQQLRCPKCQNNSIADSNAIIAADMRAKVYQLMMQGRSKEQIIAYMVARYGNFVTYVPPLNPLTIFLWLGPLAVVIAGGLTVVLRASRRGGRSPLSSEERQRLARLLEKTNREQP
ncbi:cytochrome c-type biogenesis protein [Sodalis sp. C49]|uniref:cytochrome c-type biogenesis protein n=1 Tax=unclassified Sodalis (in: enterobacteria) TaxID=2636512 RepID=UPI003965C3DE